MLAITALMVSATCTGPGGTGSDGRATLRVFAAASLTEAFQAIADAFETAHPDITVALNVAGTPTLVRQVAEGAPADVIAVADEAALEALQGKGLVAGAPRIFAANTLEVVVAAGNPHGVVGLADMARPELIVALGDTSVPVGRYTAEALRRSGVSVPGASREPSARAVLAKVALGEADAGVVYSTDVATGGAQVQGITISGGDNVVVRYPVAVLTSATEPEAAVDFVELLNSAVGQGVLDRLGFLRP